MFTVEMPAIPFNARLSGRAAQRFSRSERAMQQNAPARSPAQGPHEQICAVLAEMVPSTAAEIAEACALDQATVEACLDSLTARCLVMFNPLTKRYSVPKAQRAPGLAA